MITQDQIATLAKNAKINETVIFREYLQLLFLNKLYSFSKAEQIFFKGGTALHFIYKSSRFSEDLDFSTQMTEKEFTKLIKKVFNSLTREEEIDFKPKKTITGKRFLLTAAPIVLPYKVFISLDFSFREKIILPQKSIIETTYPLLFTSYVYHLAKEELGAEKIRAILTRKKARDLYDLWYLLNQGIKINPKLIKEKLKYYKIQTFKTKDIIKRINQFSEKDFVLDMRPFVPLNEREKLAERFAYIKNYLTQKFA